MLKYIIKRILIFIPTLLIISLAVFVLSKLAPGDPVELMLTGQAQDGGRGTEFLSGEKQYFELQKELGLHLPTFYGSISSGAYPDTLYKVGRRSEQAMLSKLCGLYGNWPEISKYFKSLKDLEYQSVIIERTESNYESKRSIRETINELYDETKDEVIIARLNRIKELSQSDPSFNTFRSKANQVTSNYNSIKQNATKMRRYIPKLIWYGTKNQYHRWLFGDIPWFRKNNDPTLTSYGMLRGDFGKSTQDGRPVWSVIKEGLNITIWFNLISLLLIYLIAVPLGVYVAVHKDSFFDRFSTIFLFVLYSLPSFWVATMLIVFITNGEYGMDWFPSFGLGKTDPDAGFFEKLWVVIPYAILPLFCMVYGSFAYLARQMRGGVLTVFNQDFIRTARAKGLSENIVVWKHAFRNSLIPIITILASILPAMIAGSLIIEVIFSIPGMGNIAFQSIIARNWPIVFAVVMLSSTLSLVGILLSDILYSVVDPRITFTNKT